MADDLDDPYFGYDIGALQQGAMVTPPLLKPTTHVGVPLAPGQGHGFYSDLQEGGEEPADYPSTPLPEAGTDDIRAIYLQLKGEQPGTADNLATHWMNLGIMLFNTQDQLRKQTVTMAEQWKSPAAKQVYLREVGKVLAYLEVWMEAAYTNSSTLRALAQVMREAWGKMEALWARWEQAKRVSLDRIDLAGYKTDNADVEKERVDGAYGDDRRSYEENLAAYSYEARVLASETASKYAPLIARLGSGRALLLDPLNARMHPGATGMPYVPPLGLPPFSGPGGGPAPGGAPLAPPPAGPPPASPPPLGLPPGSDKKTMPDKDKLKPPPDKPPPLGDPPPAPGPPPVPQNLQLGPMGGPPALPPIAPVSNLRPMPSPTGPAPLTAPSLLGGGANKLAPTALGGLPDPTGAPPAAPPATNTLSQGLYPPGTIPPPPGGVPQQPNKAIGQRNAPGVPGSGLGAPPPGTTQQAMNQTARPDTGTGASKQETPAAFQVPPATTPPVLGERKAPVRPGTRRAAPEPLAHHGVPGATPPVLANPRLATPQKPPRMAPPSHRPATTAPELAAGVSAGTAPVLDGRLAPPRPAVTGPGADVPTTLRGKEPAVSTPDRRSRRPEVRTDRTTRAPQKTAEVIETPAAKTSSWEVKNPGAPIVAGGQPPTPRRATPSK